MYIFKSTRVEEERCSQYKRLTKRGTLLVVKWLRICLPMQGTRVQSLVGELRSHMLWGS